MGILRYPRRDDSLSRPRRGYLHTNAEGGEFEFREKCFLAYIPSVSKEINCLAQIAGSNLGAPQACSGSLPGP